MSVSLKQSYDIEYNGTANVARMDLFVDTAADLTGLTTFDSITLLQGSTAEDISTGDKYAMQTNGTWVKQPSQSAFANVYTKAEIDSMFYLYYTKAEADSLFEWITVTISTDTLPLSFKADGTPLISWTMKGNGQQTGTPTPDNPVMPTFCGVRTANLFDKTGQNWKIGYRIDDEGNEVSSQIAQYSQSRIEVIPSSKYTAFGFYPDGTSLSNSGFKLYCYDANDAWIENLSVSLNMPKEFTMPNNCHYIRIQVTQAYYTAHTAMINDGSTALPYEPFGWAEKITCAGQTVPVYLGQTQTVRKIRKLVLTGNETFTKNVSSATDYLYYAQRAALLPSSILKTPIVCSHLREIANPPTVGNIGINTNNNFGVFYVNFGADVMNAQTSGNTVDGLKEYLATQYAAGTPVTVWYVLATEQTGISNEPLAKIGDYSDELSSTDSAVTIPTVKGSNTLTVESELQPSEMTITGKIREVNENEQ